MFVLVTKTLGVILSITLMLQNMKKVCFCQAVVLIIIDLERKTSQNNMQKCVFYGSNTRENVRNIQEFREIIHTIDKLG
jgi:hypothetical protein